MPHIALYFLIFFIWGATLAADATLPQPVAQKDYLHSLFDEVEVAKTTPPDIAVNRLYDKIAKNSVAYGVLKKFPNLRVGDLNFRPLAKDAVHAPEIKHGQEMIRKEFRSDKPLRYKEITRIIDNKLNDPQASITDMDWVLMSNAFRTLKAPGASHKAHLLGNFIAEYILLEQIKKQENKIDLTADDRSFLSSLYYGLAQIYEAMYKNDEKLFKKPRNGLLRLPISPLYREYEPDEAYIPYDEGYEVLFDTLVGRRLDLLRGSILYDPLDELAWGQLIYFVVYDLTDPWFEDEIHPDFWYTYFPYGFTPMISYRIEHQWHKIHPHMHHHKKMRYQEHHMDRSLRKLTDVHARPSSRLNQTIHNATSRAQNFPHKVTEGTIRRDQTLLSLDKPGYIGQRQDFIARPKLHQRSPRDYSTQAQTSLQQANNQRHPSVQIHKEPQQSKEPQIYRVPQMNQPQKPHSSRRNQSSPDTNRRGAAHFSPPQSHVMQSRDVGSQFRTIPQTQVARPAYGPSQTPIITPQPMRSPPPNISSPHIRSAPPAASGPSQTQAGRGNR